MLTAETVVMTKLVFLNTRKVVIVVVELVGGEMPMALVAKTIVVATGSVMVVIVLPSLTQHLTMRIITNVRMTTTIPMVEVRT